MCLKCTVCIADESTVSGNSFTWDTTLTWLPKQEARDTYSINSNFTIDGIEGEKSHCTPSLNKRLQAAKEC